MNNKLIRSQRLELRHATAMRPLAFISLIVMLASGIDAEVIFAQSAVQAPGSPAVQHRAPAREPGSIRQAVPPSRSSGPQSSRPPGSLRAVRSYGKLPLSFEPNHGEAAKDVRFVSRGRGYSLAMSASEAVLMLRGASQKARVEDRQSSVVRSPLPNTTEQGQRNAKNGPRTTDVQLRMQLVGASANATITGADELPGKSNYFIGNDPTKWLTNVPNYARVRYHDVYPGVDLVYYGNEGQLEYDFVVAPGGDPGAIRLNLVREEEGGRQKAEGSNWLRIDRHGDLVVSLGSGEIHFRKPAVYQEQSTVEGLRSKVGNPDRFSERRTTGNAQQTTVSRQSSTVNRQYLPGHFVIDRDHAVAFQVAAYDHTRPLVIDPTLTYSTYLGGSQADVGYAIAVDGSAAAYIAGQTCSPNFPTMSPEQPSLVGQCDAFVTKLNATGTALVYSTYLGGSQGEVGSAAGNSAAGIAVDSNGDAYVTGITNATDFPTTAGSFETNYQGGDSDAFITKLNASGSALVYSTYLGGGDADSGNAIAIDSSGDAFVTGETYSNPFPTTPGAFQTVYGGRGDAFVTELNPHGTALVYSTYLGAELQDAGNGIAVDDVGSAFVTGSTYSLDFPVVHAIQEHCGGYQPGPPPTCPLARDAFVTKLSANGSSLVYSTYLGGSEDDVGTGIALDSLGAAYIAGFTTSVDFPVRPDALQTALAGTQNAFVTKVDPLGGAPFAYSTYLGGSRVDAATAIAVDSNEVAYVTGGTASPNFPTVSALQPNLAGPLVFPGDAFVSKMNAFGSGLIYSSYLGGGNLDEGNGIAVDSSLGVYVTGSTLSSDFPTAPNSTSTPACPPTCPFQTTPGGAGDAFVGKFDALTSAVAELSPRSLAFPPQGLGIPSAPQTVTITNSGDAPLLISSIVEVGDIYIPPPPPTGGPPIPVDLKDWDVTTDNCTGVSVPPGSECTFTVTFVPNSTPAPQGLGPGERTGTLTITDNATSPSQVIQLSGQGVAPPAVTLLPTNLSFANQLSGTTSPAQTVTLSNSGGFLLAISSISVTSPFSETNTCGASLGAGGNCTISVTFSPTTSGPVSGTININDDAAASPQTVNLTGTGTAPVATLSVTSLTFTSQAVNTPSSPQSVTLTNSGTAVLNISSISLAGANSSDYSLTPASTCGASIAGGASCIISVTFSPTAAGTRVAQVNIADNAQGSPQQVLVTGTGVLAPNVSLSDTNINFPNQNVGTTSASQTVTLTNNGSAPLEITGSVATGDFAQTNNCLATLPVGGVCHITVTFSPTVPGNRYGAVTLTDNAANSPQTIVLGGVGVAVPVATLSATALTFPGQAVSTTSGSQSVTLTNTGTATLTISGIALGGANSGDFALTPTCGASLATGTSCALTVTFTPTATGARSASIAITDNAQGSPQTIILTGNGVPIAVATLSPTSLTFASQSQGTTSPSQTVTLTNTGTAALSITNSSTTGDFAQTNNCPASLAVGSKCAINVTFTPTSTGNRYGALTITDNAAGSPQSVALAGVGVAAPVVSLSASSLTFAGQPVNSTGTQQGVILTNAGASPLNVGSIALGGANSGEFALAQNCGVSVAAGASCTINVTFSPAAAGTQVAVVNINDNAPASPQQIALTGTGTLAPIVSLSETNLTFGAQNVGTTSPPQPVTLTNTGSAPLAVTGSGATGDFAQVNNCPATLAIGAKCTITVTFTPTASGNRYGTATVSDSAANSPQTMVLAGTATAPVVTLSPTGLTFAGQNQGTTSAAQTITVNNTGTGPLTITNSATTGDFAQTNNCPASLAAAASCVVSVTFTPTTTGNRYGTLTLTDNATNSPQAVPLAGLGLAAPVVGLSPPNLIFAAQGLNTASVPQSVTVTNTGTAALTISGMTLGGADNGDFGLTQNCGGPLAAGANCTITVTFTPTAAGTRVAVINIADNAQGSPQQVTLSGAAILAPNVSLSDTNLTFGSQDLGTTSPSQTVTLTNTGSAPLEITRSGTTGDFSQINNCPSTLAVGANCSIVVAFIPTAPGNRYGSVTVTDNAANSPQAIVLAGTATAPTVTLSSTSLTFAGQNQGTMSAAQTVTVNNTGTGPLTITNSAATGDFIQTNNCPASLAVGANCVITVAFALTALPPPTPGNQYGTVTLTDNAVGSPQTILLSGLVIAAPVVSLSTSNLTFGVQPVGTASAPQPVTLANVGSATLNIASITLPGQNFTEVNACPASLTPGNNCTINVTFAPAAGGTQTATLSIADNTANSPQTITLAGTGADFSIVATPSSITVSSGTAAAYNVTVTPQSGFTGTVTFSCGKLPSNATCTASPATVTEDGVTPMTAVVSVSTAKSSAPPRHRPPTVLRLRGLPPQSWLIALILLSAILLASAGRGRRLQTRLALAAILLFLLSWMACGGSGNGSISGAFDPAGTPGGTYSITISGASGTVVHSATVTLVVQ